jgi:hypothetical protein
VGLRSRTGGVSHATRQHILPPPNLGPQESQLPENLDGISNVIHRNSPDGCVSTSDAPMDASARPMPEGNADSQPGNCGHGANFCDRSLCWTRTQCAPSGAVNRATDDRSICQGQGDEGNAVIPGITACLSAYTARKAVNLSTICCFRNSSSAWVCASAKAAASASAIA